MTSPIRILLLLVGVLVHVRAARATEAAQPGPALPKPEALFQSRVRPVLAGTCLKCHGGSKVRGGLRLDSRAALLRGGEHGPAVVPGQPNRSLLIQALRHTSDDLQMPPGKKLPDPVVQDFVAWVQEGAPWPRGITLSPPARTPSLWAFWPLQKVEPPPDPDAWSDNPIDHFLRARQRARGLKPVVQADPRTLIRRVTFDLTGLPPTPEEVDSFLADRTPDAWARLVDRLLASPHYGEHWGRHWLDVVRYADTAGFEADHRYANAYRYRDYVIRSLNADKLYDRFLQEQVAGDELWPGDPNAVQATALYCVGPALEESAQVPNQLDYEWLTDAADTTGAAFLGLTVGCARCHDHKFDPISQKDYFALQAFFAASDRPYPDKVRVLRIKALNGLLSDAPVPRKFLDDPRCTVRTEDRVGFRLFHRVTPLAVHRLRRGELSKPQEQVEPACLTALLCPDLPADLARAAPDQRRAALARWLVAPANPLTAAAARRLRGGLDGGAAPQRRRF